MTQAIRSRALRMAKEAIKAELAAHNIKPCQVEKSEIDSMAEQLVNTNPELMQRAKAEFNAIFGVAK